MKQGRFSEEQIIAVLKEAEAGAKVTELCRRHGISDAAFYTWRKKYGGLEVSEMRRLRQLEDENRRLKAIVADQALDLRAGRRAVAEIAAAPAQAAKPSAGATGTPSGGEPNLGGRFHSRQPEQRTPVPGFCSTRRMEPGEPRH